MMNFILNSDGWDGAKRNALGVALVSAVLLSAELGSAGAAGESGAMAPRDDINPALLYWQAFDRRVELPTDIHKGMFAEPPTLALAEAELHVVKYDGMFECLRRAAQMRVPCDWGSDPADGPGAYIPNLLTLRKTAQIVPVRVHYAVEAGRDQQAVDDAMAILVLGRHTGRALTLVPTMIGMAIESLALQTVADHFQQLDPVALTSMEAQLDAAPARATVKQAMAMERARFLDWTIARLEGVREEYGGDPTKASEECRATMERILNQEIRDGLALGGRSLDQMIALFRAARPVYDWLGPILSATPDRLALEHAEFQRKIDALKNPLAEVLAPNVLKARRTELRLDAQLAMVRAAIALRSGGEEAFRKLRDPFGDGPFILRRFGSGEHAPFELSSRLREPDAREVALKFGGSRSQ
jgi:hypothetical protein